ncbi:L-rhamnose/proton symporter RhaT [Klebsiella quasipneumoniae subsp. similipneumoniae]
MAFDRGRQCRLFLCPVQKSKTLVVGNHVVGRGIVSWLILPGAISATLLPDFWAYYRSLAPPRCCRSFCSARHGHW